MHTHVRAGDPATKEQRPGTMWLSQARQAILEREGVPDGICRREPKWEPKLKRTSVG